MNEKIKVALVDDEYLERNLLRNCIDWESFGMEIVGEASNADEALLLIDRCRPDIIFTDVNMPITNGLVFSKIVLKRYPDIKIVVVTGFDDFEYARESIKIGVSDFIVKPISDDEVCKTVIRLKGEIEKRVSENQENSELRHELLESLPYIKENFCNALIRGETDQKAAQKKISYLGLPLKGRAFQVAVLQGGRTNLPAKDHRFSPAMQIFDRAKDFFTGMTVFMDAQSKIVVISSDENTALFDCCAAFQSQNRSYDGCTVFIGLGTIKHDLNGIPASYAEALKALEEDLVSDSSPFPLYSHINHKLSDLITEVKKYVDENYMNSELSLTGTAKKFFLNPSYLSRTFKKETGVSFVEYITTARMEKAIILLRQSDFKAFEIAGAVGICDANYFCNCFKKYTGVSVSDYRRAEKSANSR